MLASPQIAWKEVDETQARPTVGQIHVALQGLLKNRDKQGVRSATPSCLPPSSEDTKRAAAESVQL